MHEAARVTDRAAAPADIHGCDSCPHEVEGPATKGAEDVFINGLRALRVGDTGAHSSCCGAATWKVVKGAKAVFIHGERAARKGDDSRHCGGRGKLVSGSPDVFIGDEVRTGDSAAKAGDLSALIAAGAKLAFQTPKGLAPALASGLVEALPVLVAKGLFQWLPAGIAKLLGKKLADWWGWVSSGIALAAWVSMHVVKIHGKSAADWANWYFTNVLDNLFDTSEKSAWDACPVPGEAAPPALALTPEQQEIAKNGPVPRDVTAHFIAVLRHFQPVEYQYADDQYPISLPRLLANAKLFVKGRERPMPSGSDEQVLEEYVKCIADLPEDPTQSDRAAEKRNAYVDVDDEVAREGGFDGSTPTVYGRVVHVGENELRLDYVHVRAGSYLPTKELRETSFLHEGDGEAARVLVQIEEGRCRFEGTITGGHSYSVECHSALFEPPPPDSDEPDPGDHPRPVIFIGHGSHSIASTPGKREVRHGAQATWTGTTDWHPPREESDSVVAILPKLVPSSDPHVREAVFTQKVVWGSNVGSHGGHVFYEVG